MKGDLEIPYQTASKLLGLAFEAPRAWLHPVPSADSRGSLNILHPHHHAVLLAAA